MLGTKMKTGQRCDLSFILPEWFGLRLQERGSAECLEKAPVQEVVCKSLKI
jgi:hypothetical protein